MREAIGLIEAPGLTVALVAADAMDKAASIRVLQVELNDLGGVCFKFSGSVSDVEAALDAGGAVAVRMGVGAVASRLARPAEGAVGRGILSEMEFSPLIEQPVVFEPTGESAGARDRNRKATMEKKQPPAIGLIETQGFTAVLEAIDTACKAASVNVVGKEKLGGGYITIIIEGDIAAVEAAVAAGREKVGDLGKLIAAHVISRPSAAVMSLLPGA
ncbi:MAG: BMC domain-containing protein [Verrucomicrobiae bacterium]|nr:BMC domain-containing protein [Verrucomicrobiae bacterium]